MTVLLVREWELVKNFFIWLWSGPPVEEVPQMSHHESIHWTGILEKEIYGIVVSDSVREHLEDCYYDPRLLHNDPPRPPRRPSPGRPSRH